MINSVKNISLQFFSRMTHLGRSFPRQFLNRGLPLKLRDRVYLLLGKENGRAADNGSPLSIQEIPPRLSVISHSLKDLYVKVEPTFLQLGQELQTLATESMDLTKLTMKTAELMGEDSADSVLSNVGGLARSSLKMLQGNQDKLSNGLNKTRAVTQPLEKLNTMCTSIDKVAHSLTFIALNIAVESTCSNESREMFASFIQDIKALSAKITKISLSISDDSSRARSSQVFACNDMSNDLEQLSKLFKDAEKGVDKAIGEVEHLLALLLETLGKARSYSKEISRQIGEIVGAIQFHDITRQQVESVNAGINDLEWDNPGETSGATPDTGEGERLAHAHSILILQAVQLKQVVCEIEKAHENIANAFDMISNAVGELVTSTSHLGLGSSTEGTSEDPFMSLKSSLQHLNLLFGKDHELIEQMQETMNQASKVPSQLLRHVDLVRSINMELHINALNAIVKTAHLGDKGRTLEVLSEGVSGLSTQLSEYVFSIVEILESITPAVREIEAIAGKKTGETSETSDRHQVSFDAIIQEISQAYDQFKENSSEASNRAEALQNMILQTSSGLGFLRELADQLDVHCHELEDMAKLLQPWAKHRTGEASENMGHLSGNYHMERERFVHQQIINQINDSNSSVDDIEFFEEEYVSGDVELFVDEPSQDGAEIFEGSSGSQAAAAKGAASDSEMGDNVDLFMDEPSQDGVEIFEESSGSPAAAAKGAASDSEMGDNVDLFMDESPREEEQAPEEDPGSMPPAAAEGAASGSDLGDNIEFFMDEPPREEEQAPEAGPGSMTAATAEETEDDVDLGDNVDLF